jgi:hypothetical protein
MGSSQLRMNACSGHAWGDQAGWVREAEHHVRWVIHIHVKLQYSFEGSIGLIQDTGEYGCHTQTPTLVIAQKGYRSKGTSTFTCSASLATKVFNIACLLAIHAG